VNIKREMVRWIYILHDAGVPVYVGETGQPLHVRLRQHRTRWTSPFKGKDLTIERLAWAESRKASHEIQRYYQRALGFSVDNELNQILRSRAGGKVSRPKSAKK